jgi:hypothetical protein
MLIFTATARTRQIILRIRAEYLQFLLNSGLAYNPNHKTYLLSIPLRREPSRRFYRLYNIPPNWQSQFPFAIPSTIEESKIEMPLRR